MTPADFIAKWGPGGPAHSLSERAGAQPHFIDLCRLLGVPEPGAVPGEDYVFEQHTLLLGEARGYADVYWRNRFAWENKAPGKNLDAALRQLQQYSLALSNPPLLVVCDRLVIRIHTQFNGHPSEAHTVRIDQLDQPATQSLLRRVWLDPESFRPQKTTRDITEAAARSFATLAEQLRSRGNDAETVAHFLTQCLFCFFAEDVGLLPGRMFERLVGNRQLTSDRLTTGLQSLFATMQGGGLYGPDDIPWFNGGLFQRIDVPRLEIVDITELRNAAALNWSAIDVSIFGTLFERGLDPAKRSQLGAHYTDPATIARIVEPVITRPLLQKWELAAQDLRAQTAKIKKHGDAAHRKAHARFVQWLEELRAFRILDPACGSGNFLFLGLKALKDIEYLSINAAEQMGLDREQDLVTGPHNVLGIELNEYAAEQAEALRTFGDHLGVAFQLVDDLLDYKGDAETLGKNVGDDLAEGKPTLPLIYTMREGTPEQAALVRKAIQKGGIEDLEAIRAAVEASGSLEYTAQLARDYVARAITCLEALPASEYRDALVELSEFAVARTH